MEVKQMKIKKSEMKTKKDAKKAKKPEKKKARIFGDPIVEMY